MDKRLPVVAVHGVGSGDNQDRAGFSLDLVRGVHESHRPVQRVGPVPDAYGVLRHIPRRKQKTGILWEEALWESANAGVDQTAGVYIAARFPQLPVLGTVVDMLTDVPAYYSSLGSRTTGDAEPPAE